MFPCSGISALDLLLDLLPGRLSCNSDGSRKTHPVSSDYGPLPFATTALCAPVQAFLHWTGILTSRLVGKVKLVGSTISCEGTFKNGDLTAERRENPHVQSYVMATDQVN